MPDSGNVLIDALAGFGWLNVGGGDNVIKYFFDNSGSHAWTEGQKTAYRGALQQFVNVANISMQEVFVAGSADMREKWITNASMLALHGDFGGYHLSPDNSPPQLGEYNEGRAYWTPSGLLSGGLGFMTLMHEIGHGLGLAHTHDTAQGTLRLPGVLDSDDLGTLNYNQNINTIMSYNRGAALANSSDYGSVSTLMAFDIAAIQFLYGANNTYHTGADSYVLPDANVAGTSWQSIWDAGGSDTIRYDGAQNAFIDLRAATLVNGDPFAGGFFSFVPGTAGGFSIAKGVLIENASGGSGNDTITGNSAGNTLIGNGGDDTARFTSNLASYTLVDYGARVAVVGPDGSDTLLTIEHLAFADGTINFDDGSGLFDTIYYDRTYLDVFHANVNAKAHYDTNGWHEKRDPNFYFDTSWYIAANNDVETGGFNPLDHYHATGWAQGRDPGPNFDTGLYLKNNPDVAAAAIDPLEHFLRYGLAEGRTAYAAVGTPVSGFDAQFYLQQNPDVANAGVGALAHFNAYGWHEGRKPNAVFDTAGYLSHYADVAAAGVNPLDHYEQYGWKEGRDPSAAFDTVGYLNANLDVKAAGLNPLDHYLQYGIFEGRAVVNDGIWA